MNNSQYVQFAPTQSQWRKAVLWTVDPFCGSVGIPLPEHRGNCSFTRLTQSRGTWRWGRCTAYTSVPVTSGYGLRSFGAGANVLRQKAVFMGFQGKAYCC